MNFLKRKSRLITDIENAEDIFEFQKRLINELIEVVASNTSKTLEEAEARIETWHNRANEIKRLKARCQERCRTAQRRNRKNPFLLGSR